ncbi:MAG: type II toxin-antitoxin system VapC family toxin [Sulfuricellaceae bacterium]
MPVTECYVDTSALLKLYVSEAFSEQAQYYLSGMDHPAISSLTTLEWHCAMARRQRSGAFSEAYLAMARQEFMRHVSEGYFRVHPVSDTLLAQAQGLLDAVRPVPLRTLDAMHLAAARALDAQGIATADRIMAQAAERLGMKVERFFCINTYTS